ncbi:toxin biosynthesis cytochrome P450 monooxygenase [Aspergillus nomiae NRRL 13137]|uniref:Toxin biosynthesis cytochrome P450 monooxygenase n=1 Tax=Aspergillus nomiae NRRL (strain ATCC 15546 / NRRL 13137 / CBS 260.88 / M93) TaxID=1509407 RepID=A0A0L1ILY3_ASPN3|nr:toxin biosynthesis cytochrome P450 monooxygenase [Aspergillus nomiae NRRL 13137]KNG80574.1 toxin biosynthesis cytochrome P450 monooxygenase [Aspergillus nomiae NRRL 13137]
MFSSLPLSGPFSSPLAAVGVWFGLGVLLSILYFLAVIIYNIYFHPLAKFPGLKSHAATRIPYFQALLGGRTGKVIKDLHERYGEVVRIAPNELSFIDGEAWTAIYGTRPGHRQKPKDVRYYPPTAAGVSSIVLSNDEDHTRFRRTLSHAFSENSLRAQEPLVNGYVDLLIQRLHEHCDAGNKPLDMVAWYNFTTFDIIGDLAFGESFDCLQNSAYHTWVSMIFKHIRSGTYGNVARRFPGSNFLLPLITPTHIANGRKWHVELTREKVKARLAKPNDRMDFFGHILKQKDTERAMSFNEMVTNGSTLIVAGSETTATLLSAVTYYLLKNERVLSKLQQEIRSSFHSEKDITVVACNQLEYLNAVLTEGLRIFPPAPTGLPRIVDGDGDTIAGKWVPGGTIVSIPHLAAFHSSSNFTEPESFIPERFLGDPRFANDSKTVLQPFSFGPRNCIGRKYFGQREMRLILARVLYNFDLELDERSVNWNQQEIYILWNKPCLYVRLHPRVGV